MLALTAIPYGTVGAGWVGVFQCAIFFLMMLWVIEGMVSGSWHIKGAPLLMPFVAILILAFLQTLPLGKSPAVPSGFESGAWRSISADPFETKRFILQLSALIGAAGLFLRYTTSKSRLRMLIHVVIGVALASALFGMLRQAMQGDAPSFALPGLAPALGYGQFINKNQFAFLMEMALGLVFGLIAGGGLPRKLWAIYLAAASPIWISLVLSTSRGAILSMFCQVLLTGLLFASVRNPSGARNPVLESNERFSRFSRSIVSRALLLAVLIIVVGFGVLWVGGDPLAKRLDEVHSSVLDNRENTYRRDIWRATWRMIKDHPVAGVGFNAYAVAIAQYHDASGVFVPQEAHNDYLELLASAGPLGVILVAWFLISFVRQARVQLRSPDDFRRAASFGALIGLFGVAIHSFVDFGLHTTIIALVFITLTVIATVDIGNKQPLALQND